MNHKAPKNTISARDRKLGKGYGLALSQSMKHLRDTQKIDLAGNALGGRAGGAILENM